MKIQERTGAGAGRSAAPAQPMVGDRLPTPPRERKPALAALAVLLILVGALGATMLVLRAGDRVEVIQAKGTIEAGESVSDSNVTSVMVAADDSIDYIKWSQLGALKSLKAKSTIYAGTVLVGQMFAAGETTPAGKASVGVALKEGQYPADIKSGDTVAVYNVDAAGSGSGSDKSGAGSTSSGGLLVAKAKVNNVADKSDSTISTGNLSLTLLVDQADAAAVARAASANAVAIVRVSGN
ncbi:hypothetical protein C3489_04970 [Streptomyces sp. Ru71]|uniref:hypothetical protein n=1 Tax=Streptomyces sp. Ru71 TaxID=2080746 RepID=UPI000CDDB324|nr:hypothetical protein [Streptomyces sp. Ru71]POX56409.1 hypothetical protein C3489_04970 [Streptomyces sp. Ru71]